MSKKKPFNPSENHSYNVNVAVILKNPGKAVLLKELYRSHNYFKTHGGIEKDSFSWFFFKPAKLHETYPEYSSKSMYRWLTEFEDLMLVASRQDLNKFGYDKTKWYTVNIEAYNQMCLGEYDPILKMRQVTTHSQNETSQFSDWELSILKMRLLNSQNETTIHPCINPSLESLNNNKGQFGNELPVGFKSSEQLISESKEELLKDLKSKKEKSFAKKEKLFNNFIEHEIEKSIEAELEELKIVFGNGENNKSANEKKCKEDDITAIINVFNEVTGRSLKPTTKTWRKYAKIALKESGGNLEDIRGVFQMKTFEWRNNPKMANNIELDTFCRKSNFPKYLAKYHELKANPILYKNFVANVNNSNSKKEKTLTGNQILEYQQVTEELLREFGQ